MQTLRFYKDNNSKWYVDLPEWGGSKEELEMVSGADTLLDNLSGNGSEVYVNFSKEYYSGSNTLIRHRYATETGNCAYYVAYYFEDFKLNLLVWLCDVTKFVLGDFHKYIYYSIAK